MGSLWDFARHWFWGSHSEPTAIVLEFKHECGQLNIQISNETRKRLIAALQEYDHGNPTRAALTSEAEEAEIAELLALDEKRTGGNWSAEPFEFSRGFYIVTDAHELIRDRWVADRVELPVNAAFIAAAPRMMAVIRKLVGGKP